MKRDFYIWTKDLKLRLNTALNNYKTQSAIAEKTTLSAVQIMRLLSKEPGQMIEVESVDGLSKLPEFDNASFISIKKGVISQHSISDCEKICHGLKPEGKDTMKRYKELDDKVQGTIDTIVKIEWEKKHSGASSDAVDMDHDKHAAS